MPMSSMSVRGMIVSIPFRRAPTPGITWSADVAPTRSRTDCRMASSTAGSASITQISSEACGLPDPSFAPVRSTFRNSSSWKGFER